MKRSIRVLSVILALFCALGGLTSCFSLRTFYQIYEEALFNTDVQDKPSPDASVAPQQSTTAPTMQSGGTPQEPPQSTLSILERYPYTLTEGEVEAFYSSLARCNALLYGDASIKEELEAELERMESLFYEISSQASIAYILYCIDLADTERAENYTFASTAQTECYAEYAKMCQALYESTTSFYREEFFSSWSEDEINEMLAYNDEMVAYEVQNQELLLTYRALSGDEFEEESARLFLQMIEQNHAFAQLKGYESYLEYAYSEIYMREYLPEEVAQMRQLVKTFLIPLCEQAAERFSLAYRSATPEQQFQIQEIVEGSDYDALGVDYLSAYLNSLPTSVASHMRSMFENKNVIFEDGESAYEGAFTGYLNAYETPICYFGPGYQSIYTMVHELGHYATFDAMGESTLRMDFAELQSQGNEMIFTAYLTHAYPESVVLNAVACYQIYDALYTIIVCSAVDEFEQAAYAASIQNPTVDFDALMDEIAAGYCGEYFQLDEQINMNYYWRRVVIESPLYYISYAMSGVMALDLYSNAVQNYEQGCEMYRKLIEEISMSQPSDEVLQTVGLGSPFDEQTYRNIWLIMS